MKKLTLYSICLLLSGFATAQVPDSSWHPASPAEYRFIHLETNHITNPQKLDSPYAKLMRLKRGRTGRISIIHIGDSHIQADGITGVLRANFQSYFGNAGRGLVFPYQLANSNAPLDIYATSNTVWKSNRLTFPDKPIKTGISGYGVHSKSKNAVVTLRLKEIDGKKETFNRMLLFLCNDSICYKVTDSSLVNPVFFRTPAKANAAGYTFNTDNLMSGFELCRVDAPDACDYSFYGVSLEKRDTPGILYHSIGINGARFDQFTQNDDFFSQLDGLDGDMYVVSLGTNEAQNPSVNEEALIASFDLFLDKVRRISPTAPVIFTSPPASYYHKKKPNKSVERVSAIMAKYCEVRNIPFWDLFSVTSGLKGAAEWKKFGLLGHDLVHFSAAGYQLQGQLLLHAFASGYNSYEQRHPYVPNGVTKAKISATKTSLIKNDTDKLNTPSKSMDPVQKQNPKPTNSTQPDTQKKSNIQVQYEQR